MGHRLPCCVTAEHPVVRGVSRGICTLLVMGEGWFLSKVFCRDISRKMHLWDGGFLDYFVVSLSCVCSVPLCSVEGTMELHIAPPSLHWFPFVSEPLKSQHQWFNQELLLTPVAVLCGKHFKRAETHFLGLASVSCSKQSQHHSS